METTDLEARTPAVPSRTTTSTILGRRPLKLHTMITLLCIVSGSLDAISFLALGEAFASVMTGNVVFIGVAVGTQDADLGIACGLAIAGYSVGVLSGGWLVNHWRTSTEGDVWPGRVTRVLGLQLTILLAMNVYWIAHSGRFGDRSIIVMLMLGAFAMGLQGAAVRRIGVSVSTTYMTGALTTLLEALATRRPLSVTESSAIFGLLALLAGALLASGVLSVARPCALLVPAVALATVVVLGAWSRDSRGVADGR